MPDSWNRGAFDGCVDVMETTLRILTEAELITDAERNERLEARIVSTIKEMDRTKPNTTNYSTLQGRLYVLSEIQRRLAL